ncbi:MAG: EAL domain-containing protein [Euzebyaceae bacterium]|nr:EAL domain-containing protein [Euzebyaceae bacterium]
MTVGSQATAAELVARVAVERLVTGISSRFVHLPPEDIEAGIDAALAELGAFTGVDRAYVFVFEDSGAILRNTQEWCAEGIEPQIDGLQAVPATEFPWIFSRLRRREVVRIDRVADLPAGAAAERDHLAAQGIRSLISVPMTAEGRLLGMVGFDAVRSELRWSDDTAAMLRWVVDVFAGALVRQAGHEALLRSEARLREIIDDQTELVCRFLPDGTLTFVNRAYAEFFRRSTDELLGTSFLTLIPEAHCAGALGQIAALGPSFPVVCHEQQAWLPDGGSRWYEWTDRALMDGHGAVLEIQSVGRDITARREVEEALRASEERFRGAFTNAPIGMAIVSPDDRILQVNRALCDFLGHEEPALLASTMDSLAHPGDVGHLAEPVAPAIPRGGDERRYVRSDGRVVWGLVSVSPLTTAEGDDATLLVQVVDISDRKNAEAQLSHQALHDPLTDLANRRLLTHHLQGALARAQRTGDHVAVLFCDLDHFKVVNDSLGHEAGDALLRAVAQRLRAHARDSETVARFGGDEFVLVCEGVGEADAVTGVAARLGEALAAPFLLDGVEVVVRASIGVAVARPGATDPGALLRDADAAMYRAKDRGRGRIEICTDEVRANAAGRLGMLNALRRAIDDDELRLHYQPIFDATGATAVGAEALLRWQHPELGLLAPAAFLPAAEESGMIVAVGEWVLREACREAARRGRGGSGQIWINLSARELARPDLAEVVMSAVEDAGAHPSQLVLEITEGAVMTDVAATVSTLAGLRRRGVRVAVDDFGTGYSSLAYLKRFPIDALKIDRSFIGGLGGGAEETAIVAAIVQLAHALSLSVVAEGVETPAQLRALQALGCDFVQGFLLGRPQPALLPARGLVA